MVSYILKRLLIFVPTLFIIITASFFLMRMAPGSPFDGERAISEEIRANILKSYDLDKPMFQQYTNYLFNVIRGDFGPSLKIKDFTVSELIYKSAPTSLTLGFLAMFIAVLLGVFLGSISALHQNSKMDYSIMSFAMVGIVIPNYAIAPILTLIFGIYLAILPVGGWYGVSYMILPTIALSLPYIAYIARITRGSMLDVLSTNFIRTAYAKGLSERKILFKHALKPAILPVVSYLGPSIAGIMTGSVVIESIFDIPGLGRYFIQGSLNRDYPLVMGLVIFYAFIIITMNLIVDILYAYLDPKVKLDK
ncbi:MAG: oligopeptide ABC transporter permease OppB [Alphaproteobacteria bacterium]|nr:oligopeptide ABC transporter permease OppB [Alphaproteobacteria bacterium]